VSINWISIGTQHGHILKLSQKFYGSALVIDIVATTSNLAETFHLSTISLYHSSIPSHRFSQQQQQLGHIMGPLQVGRCNTVPAPVYTTPVMGTGAHRTRDCHGLIITHGFHWTCGFYWQNVFKLTLDAGRIIFFKKILEILWWCFKIFYCVCSGKIAKK